MFDSEIEKLSDSELEQEIARVEGDLRKAASMTGLFLLHRLNHEARSRPSMPNSRDK